MSIKGIIFDKDGTLFDFQKSWGKWGIKLISKLSNGDKSLMDQISSVLKYDLEKKEWQKNSQFIAGTVEETASLLLPILSEKSIEQIVNIQRDLSIHLKQQPIPLLNKTINSLCSSGYILGIVTNDLVDPTTTQLIEHKIFSQFQLILGQDSGYGSKPSPGPLLAFCKQFNLKVEEVIMVGDSVHDLIAAKKAQILGIGVLTGLASKSDLMKHSNHVLLDISKLPAWLNKHS